MGYNSFVVGQLNILFTSFVTAIKSNKELKNACHQLKVLDFLGSLACKVRRK